MRMNTITHPPLAVNIKDASFVKDLGIRVAEARKERISALPKTQQKFVMQMIETVLAQQGR
jgi:hypothetical protein